MLCMSGVWVLDVQSMICSYQVSLTTNKDGEGYPLVYVLICQRVLANCEMKDKLPPPQQHARRQLHHTA